MMSIHTHTRTVARIFERWVLSFRGGGGGGGGVG